MSEWLITAEDANNDAPGFVATTQASAPAKKGFMGFPNLFHAKAVKKDDGPGFKAVSHAGTLRRPMLRGSELLTLKALARDIYAIDPEASAGPLETAIGVAVQKHIAALRSGSRAVSVTTT